MNVKWLLSSYMLERCKNENLPRLDFACKNAGLSYAIDSVPESWSEQTQLCVVTHGTKQFVQSTINKYGKLFIPGAYSQSDKFSYSGFSPYYREYMLNNDYILLPYGEIITRKNQLYSMFGDSIFIRPDKTSKEFTGQHIQRKDFEFEINSLNQLAKPNLSSISVIAAGKNIQSEYRFVIADNKVVTGSEYRWDNILDVRSDVLPEALDLAQVIAKHDWKPDNVFVCDICIVDDKPFLLELNPFSSSGLYACDVDEIVKQVSLSAWKEYTGDDI